MSSDRSDWSVLECLAEPTRRRVYEHVRAADGPVTREAVAAAVEIGGRLAAFHLDALVDGGLLTADYARPPGRSGPGAGRPAKRYRPADVDVTMTVPPRRYDVAARVFARAVAEASDHGGDAMAAANHAAFDEGVRLGAQHRSRGRRTVTAGLTAAHAALEAGGYEPLREDDRIRLRNCPFHAAADVAREVVCGANEHFVAGVLDGVGAHRRVTPALDGVAPDCCVTVARR